MGDRRGAYRVLVGKTEGKRPLRRSKFTWKDNIKMDLQEVGWGRHGLDCLAQDRDRWQALVNAVMNLQIP
jgi:hypothetical protein